MCCLKFEIFVLKLKFVFQFVYFICNFLEFILDLCVLVWKIWNVFILFVFMCVFTCVCFEMCVFTCAFWNVCIYMCILECVFVCVLADAYSSNIVIASSLRKGVYDSWAFYLHAVLLWQAFARCRKFPTTASHRSLGHVSIPMWLIVLSNQLLIIALVSHCLTN